MDLQAFLKQLESLGQLKTVEGANWDLEIGTITELSDERSGPALLFDSIKGYPPGYRVVANLVTTPRRVAAAFGFPPDTPNVEVVRRIKDKFKELRAIPPVLVKGGPLLENVATGKDIDLFKFPAPRWHELDGGRYLGTGDLVITRDPRDGWVNVGTYRVQVHDKDTLGIFISPGHHGRIMQESYWKEGKPCPVAIVFGCHPLVWTPSFLAFPWGVEEYGVAGALLGEPLPLITGEDTGLPIPAYAEIAVEGYSPPPEVESRMEGPFGEWTGYYATGAREECVVKVTRVMHRDQPVILGCPPLRPPASGSVDYAVRASSIWYELERLGVTGVKGVWYMRAGGARFLNVISLEQKFAGHAMQVATAAMSGADGAFLGRFVIIVDDDIDPSNQEDVLWAVATRCDPATSIQIVDGCWSTPLDPLVSPEKRAKGDLTSSRAIIVACRPYHWKKDFPRVNRASDELRTTTLSKWKSLFSA